ncbi:MAG: RluA family pseudouridine synthase [Ruminococcaceae bacterium]|nr:RluA family pseudouridine synthase [Oscillospiraceae bacterium]
MLNVIYEDKYIIVCIKPYGILSQPAPGDERSMLSLISEYLRSKGEKEYTGLIHRLDRMTGGIMIFSKDPVVTGKLSTAVSERDFKKEYLAAVSGCPDEKSGIYSDLIFKDSASGKSFVTDTVRKGVKNASLEYENLITKETESGPVSLIKILLHTGRTHQIRVQFSSRQMPLLGDGKYGSRIKMPYIGLWSHSLAFKHPITKKDMYFSAPPPDEYPWNIFKEKRL